MCVLARVATRIPPQVVTPRIVGGYGSLNCFVGLIGEAGKGKDAADVVASMLVSDIRGANTIMPASGEGVAAMFAYKGKPSDDGDAGERDVTCCCNSRAYLRVSEVSQLGALMGRQGSTLGPELTKLWSGQLIGTLTKDPAKRLYAPAFGYRAAMYVGIQPGNAGVILDEEATGLPQRFLWADTSDYWPISEEDVIRGYEPDPLPLGDMPEDPTGLQDLYKAKGRENMLNGGETNYPLTVIEYPDKVIRETRANRQETRHTLQPHADTNGRVDRVPRHSTRPNGGSQRRALGTRRRDHEILEDSTREPIEVPGHVQTQGRGGQGEGSADLQGHGGQVDRSR